VRHGERPEPAHQKCQLRPSTTEDLDVEVGATEDRPAIQEQV
jgi:hypothetical protein